MANSGGRVGAVPRSLFLMRIRDVSMTEAQHKILLLAGRFEVRGSSAYTLRLAEALPAYSEFTADIVCQDARLVESTRRDRLQIREYAHLNLPVWGRVVCESVLSDLKADPPDLIHVQSFRVLKVGTWLARRLGRPMLLTLHDYLPDRVQLRLDRKWGRHVIAVSESVRAHIRKRCGLSSEMIRVIHPGVNPPDAVSIPPVLDPENVPVVGSASPLEAIKGLPFFLGAAQKVLLQHRPVEFLVTGGGPEEFTLRRLARELNISEHVTFVPNLHDFSQALAAMDIFCLPSLQQGLGTIMIEAMSFARPVIATRVGGVYSVVQDGVTGLIVPPSDSGRLADQILSLLLDPVRARAMGEAGRQLVIKQFNVERMIRLTAELYREILAEAPSEQPVKTKVET